MATTKEKLPVRRDIEMKRGMDWNWTIKLRENDNVTVKNTTGFTMEMRIKSSSNGDLYKTLSIGSGIAHTPASGQFNLLVSYADVNEFEFTNAIYDLIVVDASANLLCYFYGNVKVIP